MSPTFIYNTNPFQLHFLPKSIKMLPFSQNSHYKLSFLVLLLWVSHLVDSKSGFELDESLTYLWPLPSEFTSGNQTLTVDPTLSFSALGKGGNSKILIEGFERYKKIIFKHVSGISLFDKLRGIRSVYDISELRFIVNSDSEEVCWKLAFCHLKLFKHYINIHIYRWLFWVWLWQLQLGVDESYTLFVAKKDGKSIVGEATIEVKFETVF